MGISQENRQFLTVSGRFYGFSLYDIMKILNIIHQIPDFEEGCR
jgi:hypothetical protein